MKIVITGANGFVASLLIPRLIERGIELLLVARDPIALAQRYPGISSCGMSELASQGAGFDALVNLAAHNNNRTGNLSIFRAANVAVAAEFHRLARSAKIPVFFDISSIHALDERNVSSYAVSKREGTRALRNANEPTVRTLYLASVYGERWSGRLAFLNTMPRWLATRLFMILAAIKPAVHVDRLADMVCAGKTSSDAILTDGQDANPVYNIASRTLGLTAGLLVLICLSWLMFGLALAIRATSTGPALFAQRRVGQDGRLFTCYKFRTMQVGTGHVATHEVSAAAITPLGRFLRGAKLDELPQAWNLILNEMRLIGPRPGLPAQVALAQARERCCVQRLKPGISGLSQVNGIDMSDPDRLAAWDNRYRQLQSLALDVRLIFATLVGGGRGDPAQRKS